MQRCCARLPHSLSPLLLVAICCSISGIAGKGIGMSRAGPHSSSHDRGLIVEPRITPLPDADSSRGQLQGTEMASSDANEVDTDDVSDGDEDQMADEPTWKRSEERVPRDPPTIPGRITTADVMRRLIMGAAAADEDDHSSLQYPRTHSVTKRLVFDPSTMFVERGDQQRSLMKEILRELGNNAADGGDEYYSASSSDTDANGTNDPDGYSSVIFANKPASASSSNSQRRAVRLMADVNDENQRQHRQQQQHRQPNRRFLSGRIDGNNYDLFRWQAKPRQLMAPAQHSSSINLKRKTPDYYYADDLTGTGAGDIMMRQSRPRIQPLRWG